MSSSETPSNDTTSNTPTQEDRPYPSNLKLLLIGNSAVGKPSLLAPAVLVNSSPFRT